MTKKKFFFTVLPFFNRITPILKGDNTTKIGSISYTRNIQIINTLLSQVQTNTELSLQAIFSKNTQPEKCNRVFKETQHVFFAFSFINIVIYHFFKSTLDIHIKSVFSFFHSMHSLSSVIQPIIYPWPGKKCLLSKIDWYRTTPLSGVHGRATRQHSYQSIDNIKNL